MITVRYENPNRRYEFNAETLVLTVIDTIYVDKSLVPQIIESLKENETIEKE